MHQSHTRTPANQFLLSQCQGMCVLPLPWFYRESTSVPAFWRTCCRYRIQNGRIFEIKQNKNIITLIGLKIKYLACVLRIQFNIGWKMIFKVFCFFILQTVPTTLDWDLYFCSSSIASQTFVLFSRISQKYHNTKNHSGSNLKLPCCTEKLKKSNLSEYRKTSDVVCLSGLSSDIQFWICNINMDDDMTYNWSKAIIFVILALSSLIDPMSHRSH